MKSYLDLLRKIKEEGKHVIDRTKIGRYRIFGTQSRYDLSNGTLPVVTTRKIYTDAIIKELLWFITGSFNTKELRDNKVKIWDNWAVSEKDIEGFATRYSEGNETVKNAIIQYGKINWLDKIGEMYGAMWRNAPREAINKQWPLMDIADLPSDKLKVWTQEYNEYKQTSKDEVIDFQTFCTYQYYSTCDQLNELIVNLKKRPFSSRLVVSAWIPSHVPFEQLSPQENVMLGRGALASCHVMFQCFAVPSETPGGKHKLSLLMFQR